MRTMKTLSLVAVLALAGMACSTKPVATTPGICGDTPTVNMTDGLKFEPGTLCVKTGTLVTWKNTGSASHTVTSDGGTELASTNIPGAGTFTHTFAAAGTFAYYCMVHGKSMSGTVKVVA